MSKSDRDSFSSVEIKPESDKIFIPIPEDFGPATWPERCIYRVPLSLRSASPSAYTPNLVSIGPLHHGHERFQAMETQKLRYLQDFCKRTGKSSSELAEPIKEKEATIRRCYEEASKLCSKNFIRMILLDSVFIIELFLRKYSADVKDYILRKPWMITNVKRALMILENQLPWFILADLYNFSFPNEKSPSSFIQLMACFMDYPNSSYDPSNQKENKLNGDCGFSLLYGHWIKPICLKYRKIGKDQSGGETNKMSPEENSEGFNQDYIIREFHEKEAQQATSILLHYVDMLRKSLTFNLESPKRSHNSITKLSGATKLRGAGVKFKFSSLESTLGITFETGVLSMSGIVVDDMSEVFHRNLMAFEQCHLPYHSYVCDFIIFLGYLMDSEKDVDLLVRSDVVVNTVGENQALSGMVNNLCKEIVSTGSLYCHHSEELNAQVDTGGTV